MGSTAAGAVDTTALAAEAYERYAQEMRVYVAGRFRGRVTPEDVVQEAFARLVREARDGRAPFHVRAWLYRVSHNLAVSELRRPGSMSAPEEEGNGHEPWVASAEGEFELADISRDLRDALGRLPRDGRIGLQMAAAGYSGREIAEAVGRSELATRAMLCRARRTVRAVLAAGDLALQDGALVA